MSLRRTLDLIGSTVERATSIPLSASCMVNRAELLSMVERARAELPVELDEAAALLVAHQEVIDRAEREAGHLLQRARREADAMIEDGALYATARARSEQILHAARTEAARLLREADEYCDGRLAEFENDLERAIGQVRRGRDRLRERSDLTKSGSVDQPVDDVADLAVGAEGAAVEAPAKAPSESPEGLAAQNKQVRPEFDQAAEIPGQGGPADQPVELIVDLVAIERGAAERAGLG